MSDKDIITKTLTETALTRRSFLKWSAALGGTAALVGGINYGLKAIDHAAAQSEGKWITAPCWHNCSCGNSRCLIKAYVVDGVPMRIKSDDDVETPDDYDTPQRRACPRGRAQIQHIMAEERIRYPMKRKNWAPGGGKKELRGIDEWVRISWDEALDIAASETKRIIDTYGNASIFGATWGYTQEILWDPMVRVFNALGGHVTHYGTVSMGSWPYEEMFMEGSVYDGSDRMTFRDAKLLVLVGCNWAANKAGLTAYYIKQAKDQGAKVLIIDPWLNQTAEGLADQWVPVHPGTDAALFLGIAYHMIVNNLQDQAFLDQYCSGFDAEHMPEGAPKEDNFKDYVLGTYDGTPKTPEWASLKCGVHPDVIRDLAVQMATIKPVTFCGGQSTTKFPAADQFGQIFYTIAWMTGNVGLPGASVSMVGPDACLVNPLIMAGSYGDENPPNPIMPEKTIYLAPDFSSTNDWTYVEYSEMWQSMLDGQYGRDVWPGGKRKLNIQMIYHGHAHFLNSVPNANAGIKVHRQVEFVMSNSVMFNTNARYADLVLPISTLWERHGQVFADNREHAFWWQKVMDPLFEAREDIDVAKGMAERLGLDADKIYGNSWPQKEYNTLAGAMVMKTDGTGFEPLVTISQSDIDAMGVVGTPQQGRITVDEFRKAGIYRVPRKHGDALTHIKQQAFRADPVANPRPTASGKLEIYCPTLSTVTNMYGFSTISPIGKFQEAQPDQGHHARTKEYPLLLFTPHSLRRAHTQLDSVPMQREAFPQECFMSVVDAEERGINTGDVVLMSSPYGKVLRRAKVLPGMIPGSVALQDGAWMLIDEATGIDLGGCPNILQAFPASGLGYQCWTGTLLQVEKYTGPLELLPDVKWAPRTFKLSEG